MTVHLPSRTLPSRTLSSRSLPSRSLPDELEEEFAAAPARSAILRGKKGPGRAEIKPHSISEIRAGLTQLAYHPSSQERLLITYIFLAPDKFTVFVLDPHTAVLQWRRPPMMLRGRLAKGVAAIPGRSRDDQAWLHSLGTWYRLPANVTTQKWSLEEWRGKVGSTVFGSMAEPIVRDAFLAAFKVTPPPRWRKFPNVTGADVQWQELAAYLHELAGELAAELAAP